MAKKRVAPKTKLPGKLSNAKAAKAKEAKRRGRSVKVGPNDELI